MKRALTLPQRRAETDLAIIGFSTLAPVALYLLLEGPLVQYGRQEAAPLLLRLLPLALLQFGLAGLGSLIVMLKNRESFRQYGLIGRHLPASCLGCLAVCLPAVVQRALTQGIDGFLPFQGMFLTRRILQAAFPLNLLGYLMIAFVWGFWEGFNYVVIADKINLRFPPHGFIDPGALTCAVLCLLIHGMIGFRLQLLLEAFTTFLLIYGMLVVKRKTQNAWGCILVFFVVWNAL